MKEHYLDLMEMALAAYPEEHIREYFGAVKEKGLTEHGFPRLTANIGILLSHGRRTGLAELFGEMMDFCCGQMPGRHAANDFSVKEIAFALLALESCSLMEKERIDGWKKHLAAFDPWKDYDCIAPSPDARVGNWAAYGAASEFLREKLGICDASAFLDRQIPSQLLSVDENGMYRDPNEPMLYDFATRSQFAVLLHFSYDGKYRQRLDDCLRRAGELTLRMQSVTGEIPFGGRSNQFLFNEAYLAAVCEYEAARYAKEGNLPLAGQFRDAAALAADSIFGWMERLDGRRHIKNRFSTESTYGCEGYGYFDKYMISLASFIYLAYLFADDSVSARPCPARMGGFTVRTGEHFHKFFANCGGYFLEWDTRADEHYDSTGLGRIHRAGAPGPIALSVPFAKKPHYKIGEENPTGMAMGIAGQTMESIAALEETPDRVKVRVGYPTAEEIYTISSDGVEVLAAGQGEMAYNLPVFRFDGREESAITVGEREILVEYMGWRYRITTDGLLVFTGEQYRNRNGYYNLYRAVGKDTVRILLNIEEISS